MGISGMNLIHPNKRPQRRTIDENLFEDSISFDQDTNFRLHGPGHALTFIFGQALILGVGAIMFASRSLSQASTESQDALAKQQDATMDELTLAVLDKVSRKKRVRNKERKVDRGRKSDLKVRKVDGEKGGDSIKKDAN